MLLETVDFASAALLILTRPSALQILFLPKQKINLKTKVGAVEYTDITSAGGQDTA